MKVRTPVCLHEKETIETLSPYLPHISFLFPELELLNAGCEGTTTHEECHLDAVADRNGFKVTLAHKIIMEDAVISEECDFAAMWEMDDAYEACLHDMHGIPTAAINEASLDRIVQCAEDGECPLGEIADMIDGMYAIHSN